MGAHYLDLFFAREEVLVCVTELSAIAQAPTTPEEEILTCDLCGVRDSLVVMHYQEDSYGDTVPVVACCGEGAHNRCIG